MTKRSIKYLIRKKQELKKQLSYYSLPLKLLSYSKIALYTGVILCIVAANNLTTSIIIIFLFYLLLRIFEYYIKQICIRKHKKIIEMDHQIFLSQKL